MNWKQYNINKFCQVLNFHAWGSPRDEGFRIPYAIRTSTVVSIVNTRHALKYCNTKHIKLGQEAGIFLSIFVGYQGNSSHSLMFVIRIFMENVLLVVKVKTSTQPWILAPWSRSANLRFYHHEFNHT